MIVLLAFLACHGSASAQSLGDSANSAWTKGRTEEALKLYTRIVAADSTNARALHRIALMHAWAERYDESLRTFDRLLRMHPENDDARVDRGRVLAWSGNTRGALTVIDSVLGRNPRNVDAMQARAQFLSWTGNYQDALRGYDQILAITPDNRMLRIDRARVLAWAANYERATAAYDSLLVRDPADRDALLGLGNLLTLTGRTDSARTVFRTMLKSNANDIDALRGNARAAMWQGRLNEAEALWRSARSVAPKDIGILTGYAQALRWEGRDAAAFEVLKYAEALSPSNADMREQMQWVRLAMAPRTAPSVTYESDSDDNRIVTTTISGSFRPSHRLEIRGDAYDRHAEDAAIESGHTRTRNAYGLTMGAWVQLEPGWVVTLNAGGSASDQVGAGTSPAVRASITTPGRYSTGATASFARSPLDGTAALVARQVYSSEAAIEAHATLSSFNVAGAAGTAQFHGRVSGETNTRWNMLGTVTRSVGHATTIGLRARAFGFKRDLNDAYFDPDFYGLAELTGRYLHEKTHWSFAAEAAPGIQQVRKNGTPSGSYRLAGKLSYTLLPGRTVGLNAAYSKSGLQQLSPTAGADYRYSAIGLTAGWSF